MQCTASPPTGSYAYPAHTHGEVWSPSGPKQPGAVRNRRCGLWRPLPSPPEPPQAHRCTAMGAAAGAPLAPRSKLRHSAGGAETALGTVRTPPARQHLDLDVRARCSCHEDLRSTTRYTGTRQGHAESVRARGSMPVGLRDAGWTYRLGWGERGWCGRAVGSAHLACPNLATRRGARPRRCNIRVTPGTDAPGAARPL